MPGFERAIAAIAALAFLGGFVFAAGIPWIWHELIRPFLLWLAA